MKRFAATLIPSLLLLWTAFRPAVANHFGYALPIRNGLPCRISYGERDYENDLQCDGLNRTAWIDGHESSHHSAPGSACQTAFELRSLQEFPLKQVAGISTLFGSAHPVLVPRRANLAASTPTVLFVRDGTCYRAYGLLGGP